MFAQILATATARAEAIEMKPVEPDEVSIRTGTSRGRTRNESTDWSTSEYTTNSETRLYIFIDFFFRI